MKIISSDVLGSDIKYESISYVSYHYVKSLKKILGKMNAESIITDHNIVYENYFDGLKDEAIRYFHKKILSDPNFKNIDAVISFKIFMQPINTEWLVVTLSGTAVKIINE